MTPLRIVPLGGLGEFGLNMMLVEHGDRAIAIDCGVMFPGADLLGIDLVIPDMTYLRERKTRLDAVVLTHAHEDHIGALPYVLKELGCPVYGTRLTLALLKHKLREHKLDAANLREIAAGSPWTVGPFRLEGIRVTHSLMDCIALAIGTPLGTIIHTGDFKIDPTPVDGEMFDARKFSSYGDAGVLLLLSDSTNVEREGHTPSEREVGKGLEGIFRDARGKVFVATFASNIPRIQQVADISHRFGRKLVISGRNMLNNSEIATDLGYLRLPVPALTEGDRWQETAPNRLAFMTTGSQGEPLSALHRIALNDHPGIRIDPGDVVIFSSKIIPGNEKAIGTLINQLYRRGATVHYEKVSEVHVSGHASQEELKTMLRLTRPKYFVPVHGEFRHLVRHIELARGAGLPAENCLLLEDGEVLEVDGKGARKAAAVPAGKVFVDGKGVGDVEDIVIRDRRHLSEDGFVLAVMAIHQQTGDLVAGPDLVSRGLVRPDNGGEILDGAKRIVVETLGRVGREIRTDPEELKEEVRKALRHYFNKTLERRPVILPLIMET
jgi:ribonuclease J